MITSSFSLTATERVLPKLALDFTTASLDSRVTFTRTTDATHPATYVNSSGYITSATNNQPRFDYDPVTLVCNGLLIEESRANYILQSSNLGTTWTNSQTVLSLDSVASPDGTQNADKSAANTTAGVEHYVEQTVAITTNQSYTATFYAKEAGKTGNFDVVIVAVGSPATLSTARFSITAGVIAYTNVRNGIVTSASSVAVGNGWYRLTINYTLSGTVTSHRLRIYPSSQQGAFTGDGTSGIYIWGAQLEAGAFATSYIPTTTTALTRNADVATMTGTNFSDWYNIGAGSWYIQTNAQNADTVLTAGAFTLTANATALKKYANSYATDQSATSLVLGRGTAAKVSYYKQALLAAELAALVN